MAYIIFDSLVLELQQSILIQLKFAIAIELCCHRPWMLFSVHTEEQVSQSDPIFLPPWLNGK